MIKVIGLNGQIGNGKSAVKDLLLSRGNSRGNLVFTQAFATPLKMICHLLYGGSPEHWFGNKKTEPLDLFSVAPRMLDAVRASEWKGTPRDIMQFIGTDIFRNKYATDFWVQIAKRVVLDIEKQCAQDFKDSTAFVVFDDVRFDTEAAFINEFGGNVYRIIREPYEKYNKPDDQVHASERSLPKEYIHKKLSAMDGSNDELNTIVETIAKDYNLCLLPRAPIQSAY